MCDFAGPISLDIDLITYSHDTITPKYDTCILAKNNYAVITSCSNGTLRRGQGFEEQILPEENGLMAYPIPFQDILNVKLFSGEEFESNLFVMLKIYDMEGKIVYLDKKYFNDDLLTIDLGILADGVYEMQVIDDKGNHYRVKLVKSRN
jgi:hypothetical protein